MATTCRQSPGYLTYTGRAQPDLPARCRRGRAARLRLRTAHGGSTSAGPLGLPVTVWIALFLGLAGAFALTQKPFQDTRPTSTNQALNQHPLGDKQTVEARLWEDP